ncbi:MAG: bifunctional (p)ppGpp synthetase/guanosine-3',5'-bis(diphosphate) 3'-pyrophosphohydrolase [Chloroflexota bacterium]|nr:MAG: bifunctional (p)ppGpp synthetase/guanosine-3',5'-bis(diphosphate) 3'-pyrophosphohydrolase [Chloroflexota bacterium]
MIDMVDRAIGFAARAHQRQRRKVGDVPYIAHPVAVAMLLSRMGCDETVVAAGLLHDTVEDTSVTIEEIRREFGDVVGDIVAGCTEPPKKGNGWEARKLHMIESLRDAPLAVKLVSAADKYHNLSHTRYNERLRGPAVWKKFGRGKEEQAWYYRAVLASLLANTPEAQSYPIFAMLSGIVDELFDGVAPRSPR